MSFSTTESLIQQIHASPTRVVLATTGGGSDAIAQLLRVAGASRTMLEARVPYVDTAVCDLLGARPEHFCSARTARAMAMASFQRARGLVAGSETPLAGIACTASLASDRAKRGPHRAHVAVQTAAYTLTATLELTKGQRSRAEEEQLVSQLVLNHLAIACDVQQQLPLKLLADEQVQSTRTDAQPQWRDLLLGQVEAVRGGDPSACQKQPRPAVIFPGAFNPLHQGHRRMAQAAEELLGQQVEFELSIENVDKPPLDYTEIQHRIAQFSAQQTVWLTRAATFRQKSGIFPGATFVAGTDTIARIAELAYYNNDEAARHTALQAIIQNGCRLLVFGRLGATGFESLSDLELSPELLQICQQVPAEKFRMDISSTELRRAGKPHD